MKVPPSLLVWILAAAVAAGAPACSEPREKGLSPQEQVLLQDFLELAEIRLLSRDHPDSAEMLLQDLHARADTSALRQQLERLWKQPERGRLLLQALHDSLKAIGPAG